jgi:hypothetical protein
MDSLVNQELMDVRDAAYNLVVFDGVAPGAPPFEVREGPSGVGIVQCWGENTNGQLGDGTKNQSTVPVTVPGISDAVAIAVGS